MHMWFSTYLPCIQEQWSKNAISETRCFLTIYPQLVNFFTKEIMHQDEIEVQMAIFFFNFRSENIPPWISQEL